jgi:peptidoglycan/LPS O-acetylase OafA/YrhL
LTAISAPALLFALLGYGLYNMQRLGISTATVLALAGVSFSGYFILQTVRFGFDAPHAVVLAALLVMTGFGIFQFRPLVFAGTRAVPGSSLVRLMGRWTLEIYVVHLIAFKIVFWAWYQGYFTGL